LSAILFADIVGYTRLMAADEGATFARLNHIRHAILEPLLSRHGGRLVKPMGDGMLTDFVSVVDAVAFATAFQQAVADLDHTAPGSGLFTYRIGINVGDIIEHDGDVFGDGVNLAARLEPLAPAGGLCLSEKAYQEVRGKLPISFRDGGRRRLKNIAAPVRVYIADLAPPGAAHPRWRRVSGQSVRAGAVLFAVLVALAGTAVWLHTQGRVAAPVRSERLAHPLPEGPSIVVLPFDTLGEESGQRYFADGITEDLITDLSKLQDLLVISRQSSFAVDQRVEEVREIAETLGVRYVLKGSVRRDDTRLRINAQLIDATTGGLVWAERYDGVTDRVFDLQDDIATRIAAELAMELSPGIAERLDARETQDAAAHDAYLRGLALYRRGAPADNAAAAEAFRRAIDLDADYAAARSALAKAFMRAGIEEQAFADAMDIHWTAALAEAWALVDEVGPRPDADQEIVRSRLALRKHQHERALAAAEVASALRPNDVEAMQVLAEATIYAGDPAEGRRLAEQVLRRDPVTPAQAHFLIGLADFEAGRTGDAIAALERAVAEAPDGGGAYAGILAATLGLEGRRAEAGEAFRLFADSYLDRPSMSWTTGPERFVNPRFHTWRNIDLAWAVFTYPFRDPLSQERLARGLEAAGAPESLGGYLSLHGGSRLGPEETVDVLFGAAIEGRDFWHAETLWRQTRSPQGEVVHEGHPIQVGPPNPPRGSGRIDDQLLCEAWPVDGRPLDLCSAVYRVLDARTRLRWGDFVMVTDVGPFPFSVVDPDQALSPDR